MHLESKILKSEGYVLCVGVLVFSLPFVVFVLPFLFSGKWEKLMGFELNLRVSRKACITKRKRTGDILSPWCTPVV